MDHDETPEERYEKLRNRCSRSKEGELCGMDQCGVPPEMLCPGCELWYCVKHIELHYRTYKSHRIEERSDPSGA